MENNISNSEVVGKYIIVKDLLFSDFFKDENGKIELYDTFDDAHSVCWIYEFENTLILKVEKNYIEPQN